MPARKECTPEFKDQAVRFVLEEIGPDESGKQACERLVPKLSVKSVTLCNWVKQSAPPKTRPSASPGSVEEFRAQNAALRKENRELARANQILQDAAACFGAALDRPKEVAAFVAAQRHHGVEPICRALQVAPSAVRSVMSRPVCARRLADEQVKPVLLEVFNTNDRVYGRRKMKAALRRQHGINLDKDRIARLIRELGIRGVTRSRTMITTRPDRSSPRALDLVNRQFRASRPNQLWVCDFTYVATWSGFAYTAFITDVHSRMIVGWRTASTMTADLVTDARHGGLVSPHPAAARRDRALRCGRSGRIQLVVATPR
jgi:transposase-like protein